jgi:hypothetical protein
VPWERTANARASEGRFWGWQPEALSQPVMGLGEVAVGLEEVAVGLEEVAVACEVSMTLPGYFKPKTNQTIGESTDSYFSCRKILFLLLK